MAPFPIVLVTVKVIRLLQAFWMLYGGAEIAKVSTGIARRSVHQRADLRVFMSEKELSFFRQVAPFCTKTD